MEVLSSTENESKWCRQTLSMANLCKKHTCVLLSCGPLSTAMSGSWKFKEFSLETVTDDLIVYTEKSD